MSADHSHDYEHARHDHAPDEHAAPGHAAHAAPGHADHEHGHGHGHGEHIQRDGRGHHEHPSGFRGFVGSLFRPHSHDAADSFDSELEASQEGLAALKVSFAVLAATAVVQLVVLSASGSVALLADTIHNFADAFTAIPLGLAFWLARRPPNRRYTYGYGRGEDLAGIAIVLIVATSAVVAGWEAIDRLINPRTVSHLGWVAAAGVVGFVGNELVARIRIRVGRKIGSAALEADGYHARTDGFTSLGVVAGALGVALGLKAADAIVGLIVTVAILGVVRRSARDIYRRLMDAVDPALVDQIEAVLAATHGIDGVEAVRVRWVGHQLHAEAEIVSDPALTVSQAHDIGEHARHHLLHEVRRLRAVTIHTSPRAGDGADPHALNAHHFSAAAETPPARHR